MPSRKSPMRNGYLTRWTTFPAGDGQLEIFPKDFPSTLCLEKLLGQKESGPPSNSSKDPLAASHHPAQGLASERGAEC